MAQMKEYNKTPQKELNKMETDNLSNAEFKTLVIRMLRELIGYGNDIKKTQAEMKVALSEILKNPQGINSARDEATFKSTIWNIKKDKSIQNTKKKTEFKKTRIE